MSIEEAISRVRNELGLYKAWDKPSGFAKDIETLLAEISRLTKECADRADCEKHLLEDINKADEEIEALTKERDEFIKTIAELGKMNQKLRERLKPIDEVYEKWKDSNLGFHLHTEKDEEVLIELWQAIKRACE